MICWSGRQRYLTGGIKRQRTEGKPRFSLRCDAAFRFYYRLAVSFATCLMDWTVLGGREIMGGKEIFLYRNFVQNSLELPIRIRYTIKKLKSVSKIHRE